jgi:exodeoxyribonuclease-3
VVAKLISWNVNGIRAMLGKGFLEFCEHEQPALLCLQEVKAFPEQVSLTIPGYSCYWHSAEKKGYSGTAIFSRYTPLSVCYGLGDPELDSEGRVITLEFAGVYLVNVYTPNSQEELRRLSYRVNRWDVAFREYLIRLEAHKPVIFCGDLNVAHHPIDIARPKENQRTAGFTQEERTSFSALIDHGFVDTYRHFNPETIEYSWWSYRARAREKNLGWRIDYFCVSASLIPQLCDARILTGTMGSDHCPVTLTMDDELFASKPTL